MKEAIIKSFLQSVLKGKRFHLLQEFHFWRTNMATGGKIVTLHEMKCNLHSLATVLETSPEFH